MAERLMIEVPMPRASEIYYDACGMVDSHNRIRKMCGIDKRLRTNNWATRVNFSILSMIFVDAYLLYKACCGDSAKENPKMFFEKLAAELIDFSFDEEGTKTRGKKRKKSEMDRRLNDTIQHERSKRKRPGTRHAKQGSCVHCRSHTTLVCSRCSLINELNGKNKDVYVCSGSNSACWWKHLTEKHNM